jgi:hypothetical protein
VSVIGLERALQHYCSEGPHDVPFDLKIVPVSAHPITASEPKKSSVFVDAIPSAATKKEEKLKATRHDVYAG